MLLNNVRSAVFIGAHTDDEMICAGTLKKLRKAGTEVHVVEFSCARTKDDPEDVSNRILAREFTRAMDILDIPKAHRHLLEWKTRTLPEVRGEVRQFLFDFIGEVRPDLALILSRYDDHQDHQVVGEESERVMKGRVGTIVRCQYPWSYNSYNPNLFVSLSKDELEAKVRVIRAYRSQRFRYNYLDLLRGYARADGLSVKTEHAEKFQLIRCVI